MDRSHFKIRAVLSQNLKALLSSKSGPTTEIALGKKSGVAQATIGRIKRQEVAATIETVEQIAKAYGLEAWQLLVAGIDPTNPPVLRAASKEEQALYERLKQAAKEIANLP